MASETFVPDDIVAKLNEEENYKLAEFWARLDYITSGTIPDFSPATLNALGLETVKASTGEDVKIDMTVMHRKPVQKALKDTNPAQLYEALRRNVKHEDPDTLLVRFLRARSWKLDDSMTMLLKSLAWRIEERIEDSILTGGDGHFAHIAKTGSGHEAQIGQEIINLLSSGESFVHGHDKKGCLLQYIRVKLHSAKAQSREGFEKATILDAESTRMLLRSPITTISIVFDLTGFGMANMDMNALKIMAGGLQDNYPECLGTVYVYNAPWIVNGIWSMVKAWLDPVVASKVKFVNKIEQLEEFIEPASIPAYMGGGSNYEFNYIHPPAPVSLTAEQTTQRDNLLAQRSQLLDDYINLTRVWASEVVLNRSLDGTNTASRRALALKLRQNYWQLDPFVRGRVMLDRIGMLKPGGIVDDRAASSS